MRHSFTSFQHNISSALLMTFLFMIGSVQFSFANNPGGGDGDGEDKSKHVICKLGFQFNKSSSDIHAVMVKGDASVKYCHAMLSSNTENSTDAKDFNFPIDFSLSYPQPYDLNDDLTSQYFVYDLIPGTGYIALNEEEINKLMAESKWNNYFMNLGQERRFIRLNCFHTKDRTVRLALINQNTRFNLTSYFKVKQGANEIWIPIEMLEGGEYYMELSAEPGPTTASK